MSRLVDQDLVELVDAVVSAVDVARWDEVQRVREAFEPFDGADLFQAELRLNGRASSELPCMVCGFDQWEAA